MEKVERAKASGSVDLSTEEDLSVAIMNLISLEEHFFFTGSKTKKSEYFDLLQEVREMRKELLAKMMDKNEGETWCISKHLLATTMRLIEVGTKLHKDGKTVEGKEMFARAYKMYSIFWALRLKLIDTSLTSAPPRQDVAFQSSTSVIPRASPNCPNRSRGGTRATARFAPAVEGDGLPARWRRTRVAAQRC